MLIIRATQIERATKKKVRTSPDALYTQGYPFVRACVLIFEFVMEKTELFAHEDLFFGFHQFLVEKQDSVGVKIFFWSSSIWGYTSESINCPGVPMNRKFGKPCCRHCFHRNINLFFF